MARPRIEVPMGLQDAVEAVCNEKTCSYKDIGFRVNRWGSIGEPIPNDDLIAQRRRVKFTLVVTGVPERIEFERVRPLSFSVAAKYPPGTRPVPDPDRILDELFDLIDKALDEIRREALAAVFKGKISS